MIPLTSGRNMTECFKDGNYLVGTRVNYQCDDFYDLRGSAWRTCGSDGNWNGETPICEPSTISNPFFFHSSHFLFNLDLFLILRLRKAVPQPCTNFKRQSVVSWRMALDSSNTFSLSEWNSLCWRFDKRRLGSYCCSLRCQPNFKTCRARG